MRLYCSHVLWEGLEPRSSGTLMLTPQSDMAERSLPLEEAGLSQSHLRDCDDFLLTLSFVYISKQQGLHCLLCTGLTLSWSGMVHHIICHIIMHYIIVDH